MQSITQQVQGNIKSSILSINTYTQHRKHKVSRPAQIKQALHCNWVPRKHDMILCPCVCPPITPVSDLDVVVAEASNCQGGMATIQVIFVARSFYVTNLASAPAGCKAHLGSEAVAQYYRLADERLCPRVFVLALVGADFLRTGVNRCPLPMPVWRIVDMVVYLCVII